MIAAWMDPNGLKFGAIPWELAAGERTPPAVRELPPPARRLGVTYTSPPALTPPGLTLPPLRGVPPVVLLALASVPVGMLSPLTPSRNLVPLIPTVSFSSALLAAVEYLDGSWKGKGATPPETCLENLGKQLAFDRNLFTETLAEILRASELLILSVESKLGKLGNL